MDELEAASPVAIKEREGDPLTRAIIGAATGLILNFNVAVLRNGIKRMVL